MSTTAVLDEPSTDVELGWVVLRDPTSATISRPHVQVIGRGTERRGVIARGQAKRPKRSLIALPSVDDLTS